MSSFGQGAPAPLVTFPHSKNAASPNFSPPPSPRPSGVFSSYNPSFSPKPNYNPYPARLKSPSMIPCTMPFPIKGEGNSIFGMTGNGSTNTRNGSLKGASAGTGGPLLLPPSQTMVASSIGPQTSPVLSSSGSGGPAGTLYCSLFARTANIIATSRGHSSEVSPPQSPRLLSPQHSVTSQFTSTTACSSNTANAISSSSSSHFSNHLSFSLKLRNDTNNNTNNTRTASQSSTISTNSTTTTLSTTEAENNTAVGTLGAVKPPMPVTNVSPYKYQLRAYIYPRHITREHVVFSHR